MASNRKIKVAQLILGERVGPALDHQYVRNERAHHPKHHLFVEIDVSGIVHAGLQRHVDRVKFPDSFSNRLQGSCSREKVLIELMKAHSHDSIGMVESLLNSVAVVNIYI